jgi:hypothetical protein
MIHHRDFIPPTIRSTWTQGLQTQPWQAAVEAASEWIENEQIDVINIETVNFPVGQEDDTTIPVAVSDSFHRQFIRVWYRSR